MKHWYVEQKGPDKRGLVCGAGEELAEERLTLSAMESPAYIPDLLLENCDLMVLCTTNHTQTGLQDFKTVRLGFTL